MRRILTTDEEREEFFSIFVHELINAEVLKGPIFDWIFQKRITDPVEIRAAGKIAWDLSKTPDFLRKFVEEDSAALKIIKDEEAFDKLDRKAAAEDLFPDEQLDIAIESIKKRKGRNSKAKTE